MKNLKITLVIVLFCQAVFAQNLEVEDKVSKRIAMMDDKIALTEDQKSIIQEILSSNATKIATLRSTSAASKEEIMAIRKAERESIKQVLTEDQLSKLKAERKAKKATAKAKREDYKAYYKENVKPELTKHRAAFNQKLSANEKQTIEQTRKQLRDLKPSKGAKLADDEKKELKSNRMAIKKQLDPIIANHKAELENIKAKLKPTLDAAREYKKEQLKEDQDPNKRGKKQRRKKRKKKGGFEYRFLLSK